MSHYSVPYFTIATKPAEAMEAGTPTPRRNQIPHIYPSNTQIVSKQVRNGRSVTVTSGAILRRQGAHATPCNKCLQLFSGTKECHACLRNLIRQFYSNTQWGRKKGYRRCKDCIAINKGGL